ncbi:hypothetical protein BT69DRAFT_1286038 [Atractiella rhizophila]|nr:hypothetical protein BT69DRAFT_1286038 [Atractiella rhizophila]
MILSHLLPFVFAASYALPPIRVGLAGADKVDDLHLKRETIEEATVRARELVKWRSDGIGTLMSVWPNDYKDESLANLPIGLQEYFASTDEGDFYLLAMPISNIYSFALHSPGRNITLSIKDERGEREKGKLWAAARARLVVYGHLEDLGVNTPKAKVAEAAYLAEHPDSKMWLPPGGPHRAFWVKLHVDRVYWFGGFGDVAQIGWLPLDLWKESVPKEETLVWDGQQDSLVFQDR